MGIIKPLSGKGKNIEYKLKDMKFYVKWGKLEFELEQIAIEDILKNYFRDNSKWYPLGASVDNPTKGGLGEYVTDKLNLTPRYASVIAAIMNAEGMLTFQGKCPIELKKRI
jgi:hypothetical protein